MTSTASTAPAEPNPTAPPTSRTSASVMLAGSLPVRQLVNAGFHLHARLRTSRVDSLDPRRVQEQGLLRLVRAARATRFGRDHGFDQVRSVADYQKAVPLRTYETLWNDYLRSSYPVFENLTWPGRIPFLALTSGTTQGTTKYIPISTEMVVSNRKAAQTMVAYHMTARPDSRLFQGRLFFLGGTANLEQPAPGVHQGDLSGIAALELSPLLRPYTFPPLELAGESSIGAVWPDLEVVVHGGVKFDPYQKAFQEILGRSDIRLQETYPCSEGFIAFGDPKTELLRLLLDHGLFHEFVPVTELDSPDPTRHWLGTLERGVNYAIVVSTCAGMWGHIVGDTVRFESLDPPLLSFTGRTRYTLSAFGEHLINEEVEAAMASASSASRASVRDWHVGPVFEGALGYHQYVIEFLETPDDPDRFRRLLDGDLSRRNADYLAHRAEGVGLPLPALVVAQAGAFNSWMRSRGKLGGQNKVPRMDGSGTLTHELVQFLRQNGQVLLEIRPGSSGATRAFEPTAETHAACFFSAISLAIWPIESRF